MGENFFEMAKSERQDVVAQGVVARQVQEVQAAMVIAKKFPRDQKKALDNILTACARPTLAEHALYTYSRGGTEITGPSIRLAEALAQSWGNVQFGVVEIDQQGGESTVEAFAWDLETNVRQVKQFRVPHQRHTKKGSYKLEDPRDIYEAVANQGARRLRACILGVIPGDVVDAATKECEATLTTKVAITPERIANMVKMFGVFGVTKEQLEKRIQRRLDSIQPAQMVQLTKIYNSLKDGMSQPVEWFETEAKAEVKAEKKNGVSALKDKIKPEVDPATGEQIPMDFK